jgi:hypothetical protein
MAVARAADRADTTAPATQVVGASPYTYTNASMARQQILLSAGTVSLIQLSRDGTNFYSTGQTAGVVILNPNDKLRITYTVAPTMIVINL